MPQTPVRPRKGWVALVLSLLLPGLGHLYAGEPRAALIRALTVFGAGVVTETLLLFVPLGPATLVLILAVLGLYLWTAVDAARTASRAPRDYQLRPYNWWLLYLGLVVGASITGTIIRSAQTRYLVEAYRIPSGAMEPTMLIGDFLLASKWRAGRDIERGTIVLFESLEEPGLTVVKRVVGLPGDTLRMTENSLLVNDRPAREPFVISTDPERDHADAKMGVWQVRYLAGNPDGYRPTLKHWGPLVVPPDSFFLLGDNRDNSYDSRYYGFVGRDRIRGRPRRIYYSYDPDGVMPLPFFTAVRWDRVGKAIE